jgi:hypothetical protein
VEQAVTAATQSNNTPTAAKRSNGLNLLDEPFIDNSNLVDCALSSLICQCIAAFARRPLILLCFNPPRFLERTMTNRQVDFRSFYCAGKREFTDDDKYLKPSGRKSPVC